ncbi:hypothetical protein COLO4_08579 [Corchorus olitorius]|uniref:Uncharacterized protein n=1 Tax=Corchorus olitorius TaxID=93759 RepID=A0A1R3KF69_9ROSI|nr:hypothetical protein COLO4_08579 [Corchorus olitorius]
MSIVTVEKKKEGEKDKMRRKQRKGVKFGQVPKFPTVLTCLTRFLVHAAI